MKTFLKNPSAVLDYYWDWTDWLLEGDAIDEVAFASTDELVVDSFIIAGGKITAFISGGDENTLGTVTCSIVTVEGREDSRVARFDIKTR